MLKQLKTKKFWAIIARDGLILIVILLLFSFYQSRNTPDLTPKLQEQLITGAQVDLNNLAKQSPVLLYFWGSWCPMCTYTSSTITELAKEYPVISIALSSGDDVQVKNYLTDNHYSFPVINDADGLISNQWGVSATPTFIIINKSGEIAYITTGISTILGLKIRFWLASL